MKIATYNMNGINGRLEFLHKWLGEEKPDIVCLKELKAPQDKFPEKALLAAGSNVVWHGQKMWNGVAILARGKELQEVRNSLPGDDSDTHSDRQQNVDLLFIFTKWKSDTRSQIRL